MVIPASFARALVFVFEAPVLCSANSHVGFCAHKQSKDSTATAPSYGIWEEAAGSYFVILLRVTICEDYIPLRTKSNTHSPPRNIGLRKFRAQAPESRARTATSLSCDQGGSDAFTSHITSHKIERKRMQPKRVALPEIERIVATSQAAVAAHREEIRQVRLAAEALVALVVAEAPEFVQKAGQLSALINGSMDQEAAVAAAEERLADDLNDISARYDAIFRLAQEVAAARAAFDGAQKRLADAERVEREDRARGGARAARLEGDTARAREARKAAAGALEPLLVRFVDQRERYIQFKVRCLRRGYRSYGRAVAESLGVEAHLLEQLAREVAQTAANLGDFFGDGGDDDAAPAAAQAEAVPADADPAYAAE
jgi:hypothetical protein